MARPGVKRINILSRYYGDRDNTTLKYIPSTNRVPDGKSSVPLPLIEILMFHETLLIYGKNNCDVEK